MKKIALLAAMAALSATASAADLYAYGSFGRSEMDVSKSFYDTELTNAGVTGLSSTLKKGDSSYKVGIGFQVNQNLAIEGGYVDLGEAKYTASFTGGDGTAKATATGWTIAAVGILPVTQDFSVLAKAGLINAEVKISANASGPGGTASGSSSSTDWKNFFGIGAAYAVTKNIAIRAEWEKFNKLGDSNRTGESDVTLASVGVVYKF